MEEKSRKAWKRSVAVLLPRADLAPGVLRSLESALHSRLDPDMLPTVLSHARLDDLTLNAIRRLYEDRFAQTLRA